jgi:hypothetical protein
LPVFLHETVSKADGGAAGIPATSVDKKNSQDNQVNLMVIDPRQSEHTRCAAAGFP